MSTTLIKNAHIVTNDEKDTVYPSGSIVFNAEGIIEISADNLEAKYPEAVVQDADGRLVMPGIIAGHVHFYGMFARGMPWNDPVAPRTFTQILEKLWWRVDRALDEDACRLSARVGLDGALRSGVTTVIDHHASPNALENSLDWLAEEATKAGVRASLCYEVTDRNGPEEFKAGVAENVRFMKKIQELRKSDPKKGELLHALFGLHACITLSAESLEECVKACNEAELENVGYHIHVAEGPEDQHVGYNRYGKWLIHKLNEVGMTGPNSIFAHCIHVDDAEIDVLAETETIVMHNPSSNMNNGVGCANVHKLMEKGVTVGLGNDGMTNDMMQELKTFHLVHNDRGHNFVNPCDLLYKTNPKVASKFFGVEVGVLKTGAASDVVIFDYYPPTPIAMDSMFGHGVYGMGAAKSHGVWIAGKQVVEEGTPLYTNAKAIAGDAMKKHRDVWEKVWKYAEEERK